MNTLTQLKYAGFSMLKIDGILNLTSILQWMSAKLQHVNQRKREPLINVLLKLVSGIRVNRMPVVTYAAISDRVCTWKPWISGSKQLGVTPEWGKAFRSQRNWLPASLLDHGLLGASSVLVAVFLEGKCFVCFGKVILFKYAGWINVSAKEKFRHFE